jgi:hypothetical protein
MWYVVLTFNDDIFRSDFLTSFMQIQHHNITSEKWSDQNNERFYHVKQTVDHRRPGVENGWRCDITIRSLIKFIFRYQDLVEIYSVSAEKIISDAFTYSENV